MLKLNKINKYYRGKDIEVHALKDIDLSFRESEFVSILGPSGCGKTTLLNVIGGLDHYDNGDLIIDYKSTKQYKNHDWDCYRNEKIGFVFQSYNLIPHLSILANVELSLTLSGVSKQIRKQKAKEALIKVGLKDHINKKPNQLSGGQMQRVAIARAIVNDPTIILADEPTGALDTQTSIQVMEILKEISQKCLVIMVTHNPELAMQYSTRIIKLRDGVIQDDNNPITEEEAQVMEAKAKEAEQNTKKSHVKMSFFTSLGLSFRNLMAKKGRTILTAFAGSIGIIGIALILSLSSGFKNYISRVEEETLSTYPLTISSTSADLSAFTEIYANKDKDKEHEEGYVYPNAVLETILSSAIGAVQKNDLKPFKEYIDEHYDEIDPYVTDIKYVYDVDLNIYNNNYETREEGPQLLNPFSFSESLPLEMQMMFKSMESLINSMQPWQELLDNQAFLDSQYELVQGSWPKSYDEVVLVVDENNELYDYYIYALGLKDPSELVDVINKSIAGEEIPKDTSSYAFDELIGRTFRVLPTVDYYKLEGTNYTKADKDHDFVKSQLMDDTKAFDIKITGIIKPGENTTAGSISGCIGYTKDLVDHLIDYTENAPLVQAQRADETVNVFTGETIPEQQRELVLQVIYDALGVVDKSTPNAINIYSSSFDGKDEVVKFIDRYNATKDTKEEQIKYSDLVGTLMSSISIIINAITYVLIAFVSISLVVSSIMISIVTHISVIERTKEIGVLRSIGASKQDVRNVFNAETLFIGFAAGVLGVLVTIALCVPINMILKSLADLSNIAKLPLAGGIALIIISTVLTILAGLVPANKAAKLDPVVALRSE